jgi:outer membrane biogenesis lipoprotein LolB
MGKKSDSNQHLKGAMMKTLSLIIAIFMLSGCAQLLKLQGQAAEKAAQAIEQYCKNTDPDFRAKFRAEVNAKAAPNSAEINCAS